ncbi:hypothetical protein ABL849_30500 [Variovorax sp. 375MFSha3.1]|uniref:hypothetical protein n=1 Tax=unclassified Variovorax TaxID=663243 RepID=UPI003AB0CD0F
METGRSVRGWQRCVAAGLIVAIAGCSSIDPYQRSKRADIPINQLGYEEVALANARPLAGNLQGALGALKDQRREWFDSLSAQARVRTMTQLGLLGVTAAALYGGLKSGVTSDREKTRLAMAGAVGFTAYSASNWFVNPNQEKAYVEGVLGLTCAMLTIEPLRLEVGSFDRMWAEQYRLTQAINKLDAQLLGAQAVLRYARDSELPQAHVRREAASALWRARKTLASSEQLYSQLGNSGVILMREGDLVFARVAAHINAANKTVSSPDELVTQATGIIGKFRAVKIDAASESTQGDSEGAGRPAADAAGKKSDAETGADGKDEETLGEEPAGAPTAKTRKAKLLAELAAIQKKESEDASARAQKNLKESQAALKRAKAAEAVAATAANRKVIDACKAAGRRDCGPLEADVIAVSLAASTAEIYAARRPLSNRLLTFNDARKAAARNPGCAGGSSAMTVSPAEDAKVKPGQRYLITVNGVAKPPMASAKGPATLEVLVSGPNQYTVRVMVKADAKGIVDVSISDQGLATEEIQLTVDTPSAK